MTIEYTYDQLLAMVGKIAADNHRQPDVDDDTNLRSMLIDWPTFWMKERPATEWLCEPILPRSRSVALFAKGGTGKSLLVLWIAAALAAGRPVLGQQHEPVNVLYLDYEMTEEDLEDRLSAMGYSIADDLSHLHYALLPQMAPLDGEAGGQAVAAMAALVSAELVIVDTFGRAVRGDENEADTVRAWYRWTGQQLKRENRAFIRVDHAGKDAERGQRGTSAKNDHVHLVWQMSALDNDRYRLTAVKRRLDTIPETVELEQLTDPGLGLTYRLAAGTVGYPAGTKKVADDLDRLGVPLAESCRNAARTLREAGCGTRTQVVTAALRFRRETALKAFPEPRETPSGETGQGTVGTHSADNDETPGQPVDSVSRKRWETPAQTKGPGGCLPERETPGPVSGDDDPDGLF